MSWLPSIILLTLARLVAPLVTIFYQKGIWGTPDDPVSPYGLSEPSMVKIYARFGKRFGDWWWLGIRNKAYGLAYDLKPWQFKASLDYSHWRFRVEEGRFLRKITARWLNGDEFDEYCLKLGFFHLIWGYRLRPVMDTATNGHPVRLINMDARPILTIRGGTNDD